MLLISASLPKSGSGWYFNMSNDLLVAAGYQDVREIKERYHLHPILFGQNCLIRGGKRFLFRRLSLFEMSIIAVPQLLGNSFVVKTHRSPGIIAPLIRAGLESIKATYIYRDPRDASLSMYDYAQRKRVAGQSSGVAQIASIEDAIEDIHGWLKIWDRWHMLERVLKVRYEDLLKDTHHELQRLARHLNFEVSEDIISEVSSRYQNPRPDGTRLKFNKGISGRYKQEMSHEQLALCEQSFGRYLPDMGYD